MNLEIAASRDNVYTIWTPRAELSWPNDIFYSKSSDAGISFSPLLKINREPGSNINARIAASGDNVFGFGYIAPDLLFVKSTDNGSNFEPPVQLLNKTAGGSGREQGPFIGVSASENRVIVLSVMSDNHNFRSHIFVSGSSDNGTNFARTYATGKDRPYIVLADNVLYNLKDGFMISIPNFKSHESS